ncbi:MAG: dihydropteroate synthase [Alphaproteobacteria bacterium]|nr:MAG: dihydropteroate synthase [Alphaproteobacteria bacterium]
MSDFIDKCREDIPLIMGVVNVTPDSFSDGGAYLAADKAIEHGKLLLKEGADILDIGGESTRPNAETVSIEEEIERILPVIEGLAVHAPYISIDTRNAATMQAAIQVGANIVNDVSGLTHDPDAADIVAQSGLPVCIMHMQGNPKTMQNAPTYENVIDEIMAFFEERLEFCSRRNLGSKSIVLDPGIGFGKTLEYNLLIIKNINKFKVFNCPVLLGVSRKSFINSLCDEPNPAGRIFGSISAALYGLENGVDIFRVHDVKETKQAFTVHRAIASAL